MEWRAVENFEEMSQCGANRIYEAIATAAEQRRRFNLGLATGNTMIELYRQLAEKLNCNRINLEHLHTYNLDEYVGNDGQAVPENHPLSYQKYMRENLFSRFDLSLGFSDDRIHFPNATNPVGFDRELAIGGNLDVQLLGIGFNGHIAFNEPESAVFGTEKFAALPSRLIALTDLTIATNARLTANGDYAAVPQRAVTMGMKPILAAREILLLACFAEQQKPLLQMRSGQRTPELPASYLLAHPCAAVVYTSDKIKLD